MTYIHPVTHQNHEMWRVNQSNKPNRTADRPTNQIDNHLLFSISISNKLIFGVFLFSFHPHLIFSEWHTASGWMTVQIWPSLIVLICFIANHSQRDGKYQESGMEWYLRVVESRHVNENEEDGSYSLSHLENDPDVIAYCRGRRLLSSA